MASAGPYGRYLRSSSIITPTSLYQRPEMFGAQQTAAAIVSDFFWGRQPSTPMIVPLTWLSVPVTMRVELPADVAVVTQAAGASARARSATAIAKYKTVTFTATLATAQSQDAAALANWVVTYQSKSAMRLVSLTLDLLYRTDSQRQQLLDVAIGQPVALSGLPAEWPTSCIRFVVSGKRHKLGLRTDRLTWVTRSLVASDTTAPGQASGPWFTFDQTLMAGSNTVAPMAF